MLWGGGGGGQVLIRLETKISTSVTPKSGPVAIAQ